MALSIAFLKCTLDKRGGLEKYSLKLAEAFSKAGFDVFILTTDWNPQKTLPFKATVVSLGRRFSFSFFNMLFFDWLCARWLKRHPVDYVFGLDRNFVPQQIYRAGNGVHAAYLNRRAKSSSWIKRLSFLVNPLHRLILLMEKKTFESPVLRALITNSNLVRQEVLQYYPCVDVSKVHVVHNGVEWEQMQTAFDASFADKDRILKTLHVPVDRYQFLFIGNEYERKGLPQLMQALAKIPDRNWNLLVVGKERHLEKFYRLRDQLGLQAHIFFFGSRGDVIEFYKACDCLVVASLYDPFANVTIEALAMGLYVVSSSQNGGSEVLGPDTGNVYDSQEELVQGLLEALKRPKTKTSASAIREQYRDYDFSVQIKKIVSLVNCK